MPDNSNVRHLRLANILCYIKITLTRKPSKLSNNTYLNWHLQHQCTCSTSHPKWWVETTCKWHAECYQNDLVQLCKTVHDRWQQTYLSMALVREIIMYTSIVVVVVATIATFLLLFSLLLLNCCCYCRG